MLTPSEQNGLLGPDKLYPDADFSKLIITCSYNVYATEWKEAENNKDRENYVWEMEKVRYRRAGCRDNEKQM